MLLTARRQMESSMPFILSDRWIEIDIIYNVKSKMIAAVYVIKVSVKKVPSSINPATVYC